MSNTFIFLTLIPVFFGPAIGLWVYGGFSNDHKQKRLFWALGWVLAGLAVACAIASTVSLNMNSSDTQQRCYDIGGQIWNNQCVEYVPQVKELMKL